MPPYDAYIQLQAMQEAESHVVKMARRGKEGIGLLIGEKYVWEGKEYVVVEEFVTGENDATSVSVRFAREAFAQLAEKLKRHGGKKMVVGWLHSHPGYGCFLSGTDVGTQERYFTEPFHVAIVVDPFKREGKQLLKKAFKVKGSQFFEVPFAVVEEK